MKLKLTFIVAYILVYSVSGFAQTYIKSLYVDFFPCAILGVDENGDGIFEREDQLLYQSEIGFRSFA